MARARLESILRGDYVDAGVDAPLRTLDEVALLAGRMRERCGCRFFVAPGELAAACGFTVQRLPLPRVSVAVDVHIETIFVRPLVDAQEEGLLILRGLAAALLARDFGVHTPADVVLLAAEVAAPGALVLRRGLKLVLQHQVFLPSWFLRAWCLSVLGPPSSSRSA